MPILECRTHGERMNLDDPDDTDLSIQKVPCDPWFGCYEPDADDN